VPFGYAHIRIMSIVSATPDSKAAITHRLPREKQLEKNRTGCKESGSIPLDSGIEVDPVADLKKAGDSWKQIYQKLEAKYVNLQSPIRVANKLSIKELIDPADTRALMSA